MIKPLSREEVRRVVHGEGNAPRVPIALHFWTHPNEFSDPAAVHQIIDKYPEDVQIIPVAIPGKEPIDPNYPDYVWVKKGGHRRGPRARHGFLAPCLRMCG